MVARSSGGAAPAGGGGNQTERSRGEDGQAPPGLKVVERPIDSITPYADNPRSCPESAVEAVARSIREFGWRQPIVVDERGVVVVGHTRLMAARRLGLDSVPVHVAEGLTPDRVRAYRVADNQLAQLTSWDDRLLAEQLHALERSDIDLSLLAFEDRELFRLLAYESPCVPLTDADAIPDPPDEPVTRRGDLWVLGRHRLLCGDAADAADVDRLMDSQTAHLVNTDPPYNVRVEPRSRNAIAAGNSSFAAPKGPHGRTRPAPAKMRARDRRLENDFVSDEAFAELLRAWFGQAARVLEPGRAFYIWGGYANVANYPPALAECGLYFSQSIIWHKMHPVITRKDFMGDHEWCFYGWKEGAGHAFYGPANVPDVWPVKKVTPQSMVHLTEKPVELAVRAMEYSTRPGERVVDLFAGSGSTLIAAEQTGRTAHLMEVDPAYCDVVVQRWEQFTGKKAERHGADGVAATPRRR